MLIREVDEIFLSITLDYFGSFLDPQVVNHRKVLLYPKPFP